MGVDKMFIRLEHEKLRMVKNVNTILYAVMMGFAFAASHALYWSTEVAWAMGLLAVLPTELVAISVAYLRWHYGYARGVGGAMPWELIDTANLITAIACAVLYLFVVFMTPATGVGELPWHFWSRAISVFVANAAMFGWMLKSVLADMKSWLMSWHELPLNFRDYVQVCYQQKVY